MEYYEGLNFFDCVGYWWFVRVFDLLICYDNMVFEKIVECF